MATILAFYATFFLHCGASNAKQSRETDRDGAHSSPESLFARFAENYNSGRGDIIPLLSNKTKALLLFSRVYSSLGMGSKEQKDAYSEWSKKWKSEYQQQIKNAKLDWKADYTAVVIPLSKWDKLDDCIRDFAPNNSDDTQTGRGDGARYGKELIDLQIDGSRAKGSVKLFVNAGVIAGLNGSSIKWIDLDPIQIYFIKIDKKWYVCNQSEYSGK